MCLGSRKQKKKKRKKTEKHFFYSTLGEELMNSLSTFPVLHQLTMGRLKSVWIGVVSMGERKRILQKNNNCGNETQKLGFSMTDSGFQDHPLIPVRKAKDCNMKKTPRLTTSPPLTH